MKTINRIPRILKIISIEDYNISCIFNNGETREIDFKNLLRKQKVSKKDPAYDLFKKTEFSKVRLRNNTLSWTNIKVLLPGFDGKEREHPFEIDPVTLYQHSKPVIENFRKFNLGLIIKKERLLKGLSQDELASRSGTSKTYISRVENNKIQPELHTLHKIVEIGLGRRIQLKIV